MPYLTGRIILICLMAIISTSSSPLGDSRSIIERLPSSSNGEEKSPIKKAYNYVSEYKRLPDFNFGVGKRWAPSNGLKGAQRYSFGFGKRSANVFPLRMNYLPFDENENYLNDDMSDDTGRAEHLKRSGRIRMYDFGLGKRMIPQFNPVYPSFSKESLDDSQELRKFLNDDPDRRFMFGSSKKFADDQDDVQEAA